MLRAVRTERYTMIKHMDESGENERTTNGDLALRLRAAVSKPLRKWREAEEEIDLQPDIVETIGELEELYIPPSKFLVKPFVGLLPGEAEMALAPEEVEEIFSVPLEELMSPESFRKVVRKRDGRRYQVPVFAVAGYEIWGATAAMTAALLARLGWRENTR